MQPKAWRLWAAAVASAALLELPFPIAGPMPPWRGVFAWFGLAPLLWAVLHSSVAEGARPLRRSFLLAYLCGFLWYCGNCYWVRDTMMKYGDMPPLAPTLLMMAFSAVLGLYFGLFGLGLQLVRRAAGVKWALLFAPFLWVGLELAAARITSVPWDQLGYSQVDSLISSYLAPWAGVYGISFLLVLVNALGASASLDGARPLWRVIAFAAAGSVIGTALRWAPPQPTPTATAVLIQPNLDVGGSIGFSGPQWDQLIANFSHLASESCKPYIAGTPQTDAPTTTPQCPSPPPNPDLVVWPESPAPFEEDDPRFRQVLAQIAHAEQSPIVVGDIGVDYSSEQHKWLDYNSALIVGADGQRVGRYDKIHLVPFGEYVPFEKLLFFARKLTGRVSKFTRGDQRKVFLLVDSKGERHRYGVFICYEAVFADEVRHFSQLGAEVLVNISDDGWYGDTSAPWQHLNMARMRAIENRRWILRDTNNGVTCVIDPYGRVRQSIPRHAMDALPAQFGFRDDVTFYAAHGDVFAWLCAVASIGVVGWAAGGSAHGRHGLRELTK
jgi:apolipoprotein N-acyltransferase